MKALLVDDHSLVRHGLEMLLTMQLDFDEVQHAENSSQALEMLVAHPDTDLVLLDYRLGTDNGLDVLARIKARYPRLPVAMISGEQNVQPIVKSLGEGAAGFIPKNLTPRELAKAIATIVGGEIYVPCLQETRAAQQVESAVAEAQRRMSDVAEAARRVIRNRDLSERLENEDDSEIVSAFNSLLDEMQQDRSRLEALAFSDALTGLANRRLFLDRAELGMKYARRHRNLLALVYLDLDDFKRLNDTYGHEAGDRVLIELGRRLRANVREVDTVARLGGDEFTLVLLDVVAADGATQTIERLYRAIVEPVPITATDSWQPSVSIGAALSHGREELHALMNRADDLMYQVKNGGKDHFLLGSPPD